MDQRHATLIAAELVRQRDHLAEAAGRGGKECAGRIELGAEAQIEKDHAPDQHDVGRQRRQAGQPAERALEPLGREGRAEHRPEHRDHRPAQLLGHAQLEPGKAGRGGRGERAEQPGQGQTERGESRAAQGAEAKRRQRSAPDRAGRAADARLSPTWPSRRTIPGIPIRATCEGSSSAARMLPRLRLVKD